VGQRGTSTVAEDDVEEILQFEDLEEKKTDAQSDDMFLRGKGRNYSGLTQETEGKWDGEFEFIWMGDPQIGFADEAQEKENTRRTVKFINERFEKELIKFVVVCGDHTHNFEDVWSTKESLEVNREKRNAQLRAYKDIWRNLHPKIPLVCVCGNHDVGNVPTGRTIKMYSDEFGDDYLAFWAGGVKFLVVNSQLVQHPEGAQNLALEQEDWFEKELKKDRCTQIVFAHIPPFCWHVDENETNFNWPKDRRMKWLDNMVEVGVRNMYCAHYHRRSEGTYKDLKVMVTGAVGTSIGTKDVPKDLEGDKVKEANFKISREAFGGLNSKPETSGLYVVTIKRGGAASEKWMSISDLS